MLLFISLYFSDPSGANRFFPQFSPFVVHTKNFCGDQGSFFPLMMFVNDLTGCFSHCGVKGGYHRIHVCICIVHDSERCKLPAYHSLEGFKRTGILKLFDVKFESCVLWLADSFQAKVEGHHQQVVVTSNVCSWKTSRSGNVHS